MKRTVTRILSLALCLALCLAVLPRRANAETIISDPINLLLDEPLGGEYPTTDITVPFGSHCQIYDYSSKGFTHGIRWYNVTDGGRMGWNDSYEAGKSYQLYLLLKADAGYDFSSGGAAVNVNGDPAFVGLWDSGVIMVNYIFHTIPQALYGIVAYIDEPAVGERPEYTVSFDSGAHYRSSGSNGGNFKNGIIWYNQTDGTMLRPDTDVFEAGKEYLVIIYLKPESGYAFSKQYLSGVLNGRVLDPPGTTNGQASIEYVFAPLTEEIHSVSAGIKEPQIGKLPSYDVTLPSGAGYVTDAGSTGNRRDGILWKSGSVELVPGRDSFEVGKQYTVSIYLKPGEGREFSTDSFSGTLNGEAAAAMVNRNTAQISYTFDTLKYNIPSVAVDIAAPEVGASPSYSPARLSSYCSTASGTSGSVKNGISWYNVTDGKYLSPSGSVFEEEKEYRVRIVLNPDSLYRFNPDKLEAKVNGEAARASVSGGQLVIEYAFPVLSKMIRYVSVTIDEPRAGEKPSHALTLPSGAHYKVAESYGVKNGVRWQDYRLSQNLDPERDVFQADTRYMVSFWLTSDAGYSFDPDDLTVKVNGRGSAARFIGGSDIRIDYVFDRLPEESAIQWGDVNGDGKADSDDAMLILRYDVKKIGKDKLKIFEAADVDGSGTVDSDDAMLILRYDVKKIAKFPVEK